MPEQRPISERVRIECTDCGGLIDADMAIQRNGKPYCGECQDRLILKWKRVEAWACTTYQCGYVHFPTAPDEPLPDECPNCGATYRNVR